MPFAPGLLPYDLTRGGNLFAFHGTGNINQYAFFIQDEIKLGRFIVTPGFRFDEYDGLVTKPSPQPRLGIAYNLKQTGTVLRAAYARTFETPFNENLLLSSATGTGGLAPDWERIGTDVTHQGPFNASFSLTGATVPEPSSLILGGISALVGLGYAWRKRRISAVAAAA